MRIRLQRRESYSLFLTNRSDELPGKPKDDNAITIPMEKEKCMLQGAQRVSKVARVLSDAIRHAIHRMLWAQDYASCRYLAAEPTLRQPCAYTPYTPERSFQVHHA